MTRRRWPARGRSSAEPDVAGPAPAPGPEQSRRSPRPHGGGSPAIEWVGSSSWQPASRNARRGEHGVDRIALGADPPDEEALEVLVTRRAHEVDLELEGLAGSCLADDLAHTLDLDLPWVRLLVDLDVEAGGVDLRAPLQPLDHGHEAGRLGRPADRLLEPLAQLGGHPVRAPHEVVEDRERIAPC